MLQKSLILVAVVALVIFIALRFFGPDEIGPNGIADQRDSAGANDSNSVPQASISQTPEPDGLDNVEVTDRPESMGERFDDTVNDEWLESRGFGNDYNMFFLEIDYLEQEVEAGNPLALQLRGYQTLGTERSKELLTEAAIRGSIRALLLLSSTSEAYLTGRFKLPDSPDEAESARNEHRIKTLEYLLVAELRGDYLAAPNSIGRLREKLDFDQSEVERACKNAMSRYRDFETARNDRGLAPFDNSPPPHHSGHTATSELCLT